MSIYNGLDEAVCENVHYRRKVLNALTSFELLGELLGALTTPHEVLCILRVELETRRRFSYIQRIYGRYRKLLPAYDYLEIERWERESQSSKGTSTAGSENSEASQENTQAPDAEESQTE